MRTGTAFLTLCFLVMTAGSLSAGSRMDVQDSFEDNHPFGMTFNVRYEYKSQTADILREYVDPVDKTLTLLNQLQAQTYVQTAHFDLRVGLYKDLEFAVDLPLVLSQYTDIGFHPDVKKQAKAAGKDPRDAVLGIRDIDPDPGTWEKAKSTTLFDLPYKGTDRSGLGDVKLGLRWSPWNLERDPGYPTWILSIMATLPTADVKRAGNTAVGGGMTWVHFNTSIARRVMTRLQPYFDFNVDVPAAASSGSLFQNYNSTTQNRVKPPTSVGVKVGTQFFPWEREHGDRYISVDLGGGFDYFLDGRDYSVLFEALGTSPCRTSNDCWMTTYDRDVKALKDQEAKVQAAFKKGLLTKDTYEKQIKNLEDQIAAKGVADTFKRSDGITDVEAHGMLSSWFGLAYQPIKNLTLGGQLSLLWQQPHFITNADPGQDSMDDVRIDSPGILDTAVTGYNSLGDNEYNPVYLKEIDYPGRRFKVDAVFGWSLLFTLSGRF